MKNPFIKISDNNIKYIDSTCSINKMIIAKSPVSGFEYLEGKNVKSIFSTGTIVKYIRSKAEELGINLDYMYDAMLPLYVEQQFKDVNGRFHEAANDIIHEFGNRLAVILLTLRTGSAENRKARPEWSDEHWEYYRNLSKIILVGGLANKEFGRQFKVCIDELFCKEGVKPYVIDLYDDASYFGVLGCATKIKKADSTNIIFDFGHTNIKRAVVERKEGEVVKLHKLENRQSWYMDDYNKDNSMMWHEAMKLHNNILIVIADTYRMAAEKYDLDDEIMVSIASYTVGGVLNDKRGGYAKLTLLGTVYEEVLEKDLRQLLGKNVKVSLIHDGTAVAYHFGEEKNAVCMSIGTAFGVGFPDM